MTFWLKAWSCESSRARVAGEESPPVIFCKCRGGPLPVARTRQGELLQRPRPCVPSSGGENEPIARRARTCASPCSPHLPYACRQALLRARGIFTFRAAGVGDAPRNGGGGCALRMPDGAGPLVRPALRLRARFAERAPQGTASRTGALALQSPHRAKPAAAPQHTAQVAA